MKDENQEAIEYLLQEQHVSQLTAWEIDFLESLRGEREGR